jgi:hypothetical protein
MDQVFGDNVEALFDPGSFDIGGTAPARPNDIAHMKPVIHSSLASAVGKTHGADFRISEPEHAYLTPAKLLTMTTIDLLYGDAAQARDPRRIRAGNDQRQLPCFRTWSVPHRALQARGVRLRDVGNVGAPHLIDPLDR